MTFNSEIPPAEAVSAPVDAAPAEDEARDLQQINTGGQCSLSFPCQGNDAGMCCSNHGYCGTGWDCECLPLFSPPLTATHISRNVTFYSLSRLRPRKLPTRPLPGRLQRLERRR